MIIGLVAAAALGAVTYMFAAYSRESTGRKRMVAAKGNWKEDTTDSFTGWLDRLRQGIDREIKNETI